MVDFAAQIPVGALDAVTLVLLLGEQVLIGSHDLGEHFGDLLGGLDVLGERHRPAHRDLAGAEGGTVRGSTGALGQPVPTPDDLRGVIQGQLTVGS